MAKKTKSEDPEIEFSAKFKGAEKFKEWSKMKKGCGHKGCSCNGKSSDGMGGMLYFVGFVGAVVYWMKAAAGFGAVVTGFLKALVWPAYIVFKLLESFYGLVN